MNSYNEYLKNMLPTGTDESKYQKKFAREARLGRDGYYNWQGEFSRDPRTVFLKGLLSLLKVEFKSEFEIEPKTKKYRQL